MLKHTSNFVILKYGESEKWKWSCSVLSDSALIDCSLPGSSIHGIFQARILEWVAISFSKKAEIHF